MARWWRVGLAAAFSGLLLTGCSANHHSIYRSRVISPAGPSITTVDAKQRAYLASPAPGQTTAAGQAADTPALRICAEPSPDVFAVIAQSLSATGSFGQGADPRSVQAAASLAGASAEQASTIPRTQTVNMLREAMYRTCERYMNRAIGDLEMPIQAVRDQRLMVAILAIEQLTGAVTPGAVTIGAAGTAAAGASAQEAAVRIDDAWRDLQAADTLQRQRQTEFDALNTASPTCESLKANSDLTAETTKRDQCSRAEALLVSARAQRQQASQHYEALRSASAAGGGGPASASTEVMDTENNAAIARAHSEAVANVARAVQFIVHQNYQQDEFLLLCIRLFSAPAELNTAADIRTGIISICSDHVIQTIRRNAALAGAEAQEITGAAQMLRMEADPRFDAYWSRVSNPDGVTADPIRVADVIDQFIRSRGGNPSQMDRLIALRLVTGRDLSLILFRRLSPGHQSGLAGMSGGE